MLLRFSKLLVVALGTVLATAMLLFLRFVLVSRNLPPNFAVDAFALLRSPWLILGLVAVLVLAVWTSYEWIFKS